MPKRSNTPSAHAALPSVVSQFNLGSVNDRLFLAVIQLEPEEVAKALREGADVAHIRNFGTVQKSIFNCLLECTHNNRYLDIESNLTGSARGNLYERVLDLLLDALARCQPTVQRRVLMNMAPLQRTGDFSKAKLLTPVQMACASRWSQLISQERIQRILDMCPAAVWNTYDNRERNINYALYLAFQERTGKFASFMWDICLQHKVATGLQKIAHFLMDKVFCLIFWCRLLRRMEMFLRKFLRRCAIK
jgi:hypothetical protein